MLIRKPFSEYFLQKYNEAFVCFIDGKWVDAKQKFKRILASMWPDDPLTLYHLRYINERDLPPVDWKGFKFLVE
jgi:hypothetical protein